MSDPNKLDELLSEYERRQRGNSPVAPEELCRAHPELLPQVLWHVRALDALPKPEDTPGREHSNASGVSVCAETHSRYGKLRFHASGGLGEVSVACDRMIGREVAVKRLRAPFDADPERRDRFLREAILTGGLEHPGIVPVYGVGADDDGRPCYAMRLLRGPTLGDAIRSYHAGPADSVAFRELLGRFVSLCQAVAYAHERGIVHRDIKPGNVVVGAFGETVLLDWGLAKHLGDREERPIADEANALPSVHTRAGLVMGTPGYMAPEQDSGEPAGRPADIFSLGATLKTLLTNRAPHEPPSGGAKTPLPLAAIARKATSPRPEDRYPSALALADDVNHWLADQSIVAHRDPPWERLARWGRRNRTAVRAGLASLLVSLVVLAVASVLLVRSRDRERTAAELATRRKTEADENYRRAREAVDDLFVSVSEGRLKTLPGAQPYRVELLRTALKYYSRFLDDRRDDPANRVDIAATYSKVAVIVGEVESSGAAVTWDERAITAWRDLCADERGDVACRRGLAGALDLYGYHLSQTNRLPAAEAALDESVTMLEAIHAAEPENREHAAMLARALVNASLVQGKLGKNEAAIRTGQRGLTVDELVLQRQPGDLLFRRRMAAQWMNLGLDLFDLDRGPEALTALKRSRQLYEELARELNDHPERRSVLADAAENPRRGLALAEFNIGLVLLSEEHFSESRERLAVAARLAQAIATENPAVRMYREVELAARTNASIAGLELSLPSAELTTDTDAAIGLGEKLIVDDASNPDYQARLALALAVRGTILARLGQVREANESWSAAEKRSPPKTDSTTLQMLRSSLLNVRATGRIALGDEPGAARDAELFREAMARPSAGQRVAAARVFAQCASLASGPARKTHEDAALNELERAIRQGYRRSGSITTDPAFKSLQARPEFKDIPK